MNDFDIDFVVNTKEVLATYRGKYGVSNLLNCTLGLIILPYENVKGKGHLFWNTEINKVKDLPAFTLHYFEPIRGLKKGKTKYWPKTLEVLLNKIRNGLPHQNIEPITDNKIFKGVIISNYFDEAHAHEDLRIDFSKEELKRFALFIADHYLALSKQPLGNNSRVVVTASDALAPLAAIEQSPQATKGQGAKQRRRAQQAAQVQEARRKRRAQRKAEQACMGCGKKNHSHSPDCEVMLAHRKGEQLKFIPHHNVMRRISRTGG